MDECHFILGLGGAWSANRWTDYYFGGEVISPELAEIRDEVAKEQGDSKMAAGNVELLEAGEERRGLATVRHPGHGRTHTLSVDGLSEADGGTGDVGRWNGTIRVSGSFTPAEVFPSRGSGRSGED